MVNNFYQSKITRCLSTQHDCVCHCAPWVRASGICSALVHLPRSQWPTYSPLSACLVVSLIVTSWVTAFTCSDSLVFKQNKCFVGSSSILMWYLLQPDTICSPEAVRWTVWILGYNSVFEPLCPWRLQSLWLKGITLIEHFNSKWTFSVALPFSYMMAPDLKNAVLRCKVWGFSPSYFNLQLVNVDCVSHFYTFTGYILSVWKKTLQICFNGK